MQGAVSSTGEGPAPLAVCCWRGRATLNILVAKHECTQMLEQLQRQPPAAAAASVPEGDAAALAELAGAPAQTAATLADPAEGPEAAAMAG